jgi:hypothetical protein
MLLSLMFMMSLLLSSVDPAVANVLAIQLATLEAKLLLMFLQLLAIPHST